MKNALIRGENAASPADRRDTRASPPLMYADLSALRDLSASAWPSDMHATRVRPLRRGFRHAIGANGAA